MKCLLFQVVRPVSVEEQSHQCLPFSQPVREHPIITPGYCSGQSNGGGGGSHHSGGGGHHDAGVGIVADYGISQAPVAGGLVTNSYGITGGGVAVSDSYGVTGGGVVDNYGGGGGLVSDGYGVVSDSYIGGGISQTSGSGYSPPSNFVDTQGYNQPDSYGNPLGDNLKSLFLDYIYHHFQEDC